MTWLVVWSSLLFALGLTLGAWVGYGRGRDQGYGEYEEELGRLQARPAEIAHEDYVPPQKRAEMDQLLPGAASPVTQGTGRGPGHESGRSAALPRPYAFLPWSLLNADPPTLGEEIQAMIANANAVPSVRWLDRLEAGQ